MINSARNGSMMNKCIVLIVGLMLVDCVNASGSKDQRLPGMPEYEIKGGNKMERQKILKTADDEWAKREQEKADGVSDIIEDKLPLPEKVRSRKDMTRIERWSVDFNFKHERLSFAVSVLRDLCGVTNGEMTSEVSKLLPKYPNLNSYAVKDIDADKFAREYALRSFVNKNSDLFRVYAGGESHDFSAISPKVKGAIFKAYQDGCKESKKRMRKGVLGSNLVFPDELLYPKIPQGF